MGKIYIWSIWGYELNKKRYFMTALRRPDKLRRFRDGMCAVVGIVRKKKNMELQWGRSIAAGAVDCWKRGMNDQQ